MPIGVRWAAATHAGAVRTTNQDALLRGPDIFAVADGMGGHTAGEVASAMAIAHLANIESRPSVAEVVAAVQGANAAILAAGAPGSGREGMGTTVAGVALGSSDSGDVLIAFNVGDSRVYVFDGTALRQVSVDHSVVAEMVDAGRLSAAAARSHPSRNVVTRALGISTDVEVDYWVLEARLGDRYLICSDGLSNEVSDAVIEAVLTHQRDPQLVVDALLSSALEAGARDNVSVVVVDVDHIIEAPAALDLDTNPRPEPAATERATAEPSPGAVRSDVISGVPSNLDGPGTVLG